MKFIKFLIIVGIIAVVWVAMQFRAPDSDGAYVEFEIESGQSAKVIGDNLMDSGLIRSAFVFKSYTSFIKAETDFKAGKYRLSSADGLRTIVDILTTGTDEEATKVTLIEGWTVQQYQTHLESVGFDGDRFRQLSGDAARWKGDYAFLETVPDDASLEGYLFPDTYAITVARDTEALVVMMLDTFERKVITELGNDLAASDKGLHEILILASIIEGEVNGKDDRRMVADIFNSRLSINMALQSDATINFLTDSGRSRSTAEDLEIDSPYNTYKYPGLPPGPIGNPGFNAIEATLNPKANDFLYFLTDTEGNVHYGQTFEDHQRNRELYL